MPARRLDLVAGQIGDGLSDDVAIREVELVDGGVDGVDLDSRDHVEAGLLEA